MAEGSITELVPAEPMPALPDHERHSNVPQTLLEISNRIATFRSLDQQLIVLVDALAEALGAERGTLFLYDTVNDELYSHVAQGNINREIRLERDKGIAGYVFT
ncbi:MAG TPA: adenylate/guanylate cyclase domain-containing protein, partial [Alphaproteobacteria bacterium]|nr:adenylate/guanylate cyclase domain-containing protein [Alphaproteobacteria bacterium]